MLHLLRGPAVVRYLSIPVLSVLLHFRRLFRGGWRNAVCLRFMQFFHAFLFLKFLYDFVSRS